ncbi:MAG: hypothetical protein HY286_05585 [Planctomycetes bacterium]|nr:hypothetical protein [Planctomycetota bacterium]
MTLPTIPKKLVICAAALGAFASCKTVPHALDDLKSIHMVPGNTLEHRFEVERYSFFSALLLWGPLSHIPGVGGKAARSTERIDDPAEFCVSNLKILRSVNLNDVTESAEVVFWAGAIAEADPFPLARIEGLRLLADVVHEFQPDPATLGDRSVEYLQSTKKRFTRIKELFDLSLAGTLTDEQKNEYIQTAKELGVTPASLASEARDWSRILASCCLVETDTKVRDALATGSMLLMARGALLQLDRSLGDAHERVRVAAAREMIAALGPAALPRIVARLQEDANVDVRRAVVAFAGDSARIGAVETEPIIKFLAGAVKDPEPAVAVNAMESLGRLTGVGRQYDADWWGRWYEKRVQNEVNIK